MLFSWKDECAGWGNGHEAFHIVKDNLKEDDISKALLEIFGDDGFVAEGVLSSNGASFETSKEDIFATTQKLSEMFPDAICFGQDCWDYPEYILCMEKGEESRKYSAEFNTLEINSDFSDEEELYYDAELQITAGSGYTFYAGGGANCERCIDEMRLFAELGAL